MYTWKGGVHHDLAEGMAGRRPAGPAQGGVRGVDLVGKSLDCQTHAESAGAWSLYWSS